MDGAALCLVPLPFKLPPAVEVLSLPSCCGTVGSNQHTQQQQQQEQHAAATQADILPSQNKQHIPSRDLCAWLTGRVPGSVLLVMGPASDHALLSRALPAATSSALGVIWRIGGCCRSISASPLHWA